MSKRKRFDIATDVSQALSDTVKAVENNVGSPRYSIVALSRIEEDPNNPRELSISIRDLQEGLDPQDKYLNKKKTEKKELESLAFTIKEKGVINPIIIYKHSDKYRLVAGERRLLASVIVGKTDIPARILDEKPRDLSIRVLQWIENNERSDLLLKERLKNIKQILDAYTLENPEEKITKTILQKLTGLSSSQATSYLSVLRASDEIKKLIESEKINNLDKASILVGIKNEHIKKIVLAACYNGESLKKIKALIIKEKSVEKAEKQPLKQAKRGRKTSTVKLGNIKNVAIVKSLLETVLAHPNYNEYSNEFKNADLKSLEGAQEAFKKLINLIARRIENA